LIKGIFEKEEIVKKVIEVVMPACRRGRVVVVASPTKALRRQIWQLQAKVGCEGYDVNRP